MKEAEVIDADKTGALVKTVETSGDIFSFLKKLGNQFADGILVFDGTSVVYANSALLELLGVSDLEELNKKHLSGFLPEAEREEVRLKALSVLRGELPSFKHEFKITRDDGSEAHFFFTFSRLSLGDRNYVVVVVRDITAFRKAELESRENRVRYKAIVEKSNDGIYVYRGDRFLFFNDRVCEITGYSRKELENMDIWEPVHPDDRQRLWDIAQRRERGEEAPDTYEARLITKDGETRYCEFSVAAVQYRGEYAALGIVRDITERKRGEEAIRFRDQILQAVSGAARSFLRSPIFENHVEEVLSKFGEAADVSRVYLLQLDGGENVLEEMIFKQWAAPGVKEDSEGEDGQILRENFPRKWLERLSEGELVYSLTETEGEVPQSLLRYRGFKSVVIVPIFVKEKLWGVLGFEDCKRPRKWSTAERDALKTAADIIGAAIQGSQMEKELNKLLNAVKMLKDAVLVVDMGGRIIDMNRAAQELWGGRDLSDFKGKPLLDLLPEPMARKAERDLKEVFARGYIEGREYRNVTKGDKQNQVFSVSANLVLDSGGEPYGVVIIGRNVTDKKKAEDQLEESEKRYRYLFERSQVVNIVVGMDGQILDANESALKMLGYTKEEVIGKNAMDFVVPSERKWVWKFLKGDLLGLDTGQIEVDIIAKKGGVKTLLFAEGHANVFKDGRRVGVLLSALDITERKRQSRVQELLYRISNAVHTAKNLTDLFEVIRSELGRLINTENFFIALYDREKDTISLPYFRDEKDHFDTFPAGKTLTAYVIKNEKPLLVRREEVDELVRKGLVEIIGSRSKIWLGVPLKVKGEVIGAIVVQSYTDPFAYSRSDLELLQFASDQIAIAIERKRAEKELEESLKKLRSVLEGTIQAIAGIVETRDPYTAGHQRRVADLACAIAREMNLSEDRIEGIRMAATIHDIGKIAVPAEILSKPGELSDVEMSIIKTHSQVGYEILKGIDFPWPIAEIVYQHHERLDGSGYPRGLKGDEILLEARILAVADVVEAMISHRPYRPALTLDVALKEITENSGTLYDPEVVKACRELFLKKKFRFENSR